MVKIKVEAFISSESISDTMSSLLDNIEMKFKDKVKINRYSDKDPLFTDYELAESPALVIDEMIRIIGFCPSVKTVVAALKDLGLD